MIRLASVFERFEADFLAQYRHRLDTEHLRALAAIRTCRLQTSPQMELHCTECAQSKWLPHSCGHRLCPHCQHHESQQWLERQWKRQVPAEYFMVTFTLPAEFRPLARAHPRLVLDRLLRCAWETVNTFSHNDRALRGMPGALAVLHTQTRRLDFHPHVHLVMPAAAVDPKHGLWRTKQGYLFNERALAKVFRAKLLAALGATRLAFPGRFPKEWVAHCKSVGSGEKALLYLGRYLYRGVIREQDILGCENGEVTFQYRDADTGRMEKRTVAGAKFLWLILQHVLPKGFRRVRHFGFLHPNRKRLIALLWVLLKRVPVQAADWVRKRAPVLCPCCGTEMTIVRRRVPSSLTGDPPRARGTL